MSKLSVILEVQVEIEPEPMEDIDLLVGDIEEFTRDMIEVEFTPDTVSVEVIDVKEY